MPRKPTVPHADLIATIVSTPGVINSDSGFIHGPTHQIWKDICAMFEGKVSPNYVYQYVKENRHDCFEELKRHLNISSPLPQASPLEHDNSLSSSSSNSNVAKETLNAPILPQKTFVVLLTTEEYTQIKPVQKVYARSDRYTGERIVFVLPANAQNLIVKRIWDQHRIPCAFAIKRSRVFATTINDAYILIDAYCAECGAVAIGRILCKPIEGEDVQIEWRTNDTRNVPHEKKRPLKGIERKIVSNNLQNVSVSVYRKHKAAEMMDQGDIEAPTLYTNTVLRKVKQNDINTQIPYDTNPILRLCNMKHSEPFAGKIHDIAIDKINVHYYTQSQLIIYKLNSKSGPSILSIDATGSLVKKIKRPHGLSGNIFLYEAVLNTGLHQVPVLQMLSEKHDANTILYWLNEWERVGAPQPNEIIIDNSPALKSATSRSFGRCSDIFSYKEKCFLFLMGTATTLPACYIRIDVAHFLNAARKWQTWADKSRGRLKELYMRCLSMLILALSLEEFQEILENVLVLALSQYEGLDNNGEELPMEKSLRFLTNKIKNINTEELEKEEDNERQRQTFVRDEFEETSNIGKSIYQETSSTLNWVNKVDANITKKLVHVTNGRLNPYYAPEIATHFRRLSSDFVLWSAVMVKAYKSPNRTASSAPVESDFADLKNNVLKGVSKPIRIDKFIEIHLKSIEGACRIAGAVKKREDNELEIIVDEEMQDEIKAPKDLNSLENWRGLAEKKITKRKSKYLTSFPEIDSLLQAKKIKLPPARLLINGNLAGFSQIKKDTFIQVNNTCAYDALVQVIAAAYAQHTNYKEFIDQSSNKTLQLGKALVLNGASKSTYKLRCIALSEVLEPVGQLSLQKENSTGIEYDCWSNAPTLARKVLADVHSANITTFCPKSCSKSQETGRYPVLDTNINIILECGLHFLNRAILSTLRIIHNIEDALPSQAHITLSRCLQPCEASPTIHCELGPHLIIDVDYMSQCGVSKLLATKNYTYNRPCSLSEIPVNLQILDSEYNLAGVIAHTPGHYVAYVRRLQAYWEIYDDLSKKEIRVHNINAQDVRPHLIVYVKL